MIVQKSYFNLSLTKYAWHIVTWNSQRRYLFRWIKSLNRDYLLDEPSPWMNFDAICYLHHYLENKPDANMFEYGSGGSTLYWIKMGARIVSIEHDAAWYTLVKLRIGLNDHVDYRLVEPEFRGGKWATTSDPASPNDYATLDTKLRNYSFDRYVKQIDCFPDNYFDVIIIDGRSRPACLKHSISKLAIGGLLVLDNADRSYYLTNTDLYLTKVVSHSFFGICPASDAPGFTMVFEKYGS